MPSTQFISSIVQKYGEAILILGTRKAESASRARVMNRFEGKRGARSSEPQRQSAKFVRVYAT